MSDLAETWMLVRGRFLDSIKDLNAEQLNWRIHPEAMTIGEMALHVAGTEVFFCRQLLELEMDDFGQRLEKCAMDSVVNNNPFPFEAGEITPDLVQHGLEMGRIMVDGPIHNLTDDLRGRSIQSVLGPIVNGTGAMARLAYHPAYHHGQVYLVRNAPGFPS